MRFSLSTFLHQWPRLAALLFILFHISASEIRAAAQQTHTSDATQTLNRSVFDPSASPIPNAQISLFTLGGNLFATTTDRMGSFHLESIPRGKYSLQVQSSGFKDATLEISDNVPAPTRDFFYRFVFSMTSPVATSFGSHIPTKMTVAISLTYLAHLIPRVFFRSESPYRHTAENRLTSSQVWMPMATASSTIAP